MVKKRQDLGVTAVRVARNVREVRQARGLSVTQLVKRLSGKLSVDAVKKIEAGANPDAAVVRRVSVDELVLLAIALDTTPNRLLLGPRADDEDLELTDAQIKLPNNLVPSQDEPVDTSPSARDAWRWARGGEPLHLGPSVYPLPEDEEDEMRRYQNLFAQQEIRRRRFQQESRPDDVPDFTDFGRLPVEKQAVLDEMADTATPAVLSAMDTGLPWKTVVRRLRIQVDKILWQRRREYLANRTPEDVEREREEGKRAADELMRQRHPGRYPFEEGTE
ncbi:helix-turn-helix domain-containing protein [Nocardiopsis sp. Huas11]|uniref:helix-turn-helix domain-containing protein n=1 Tax=Nocardiopsis sp. Huas11 TaxID=2183912 RepID=UPI0011C41EE6|nr:helix-turn-helix transcriptional regulator [Nocardiopsis sp. Huas11]